MTAGSGTIRASSESYASKIPLILNAESRPKFRTVKIHAALHCKVGMLSRPGLVGLEGEGLATAREKPPTPIL